MVWDINGKAALIFMGSAMGKTAPAEIHISKAGGTEVRCDLVVIRVIHDDVRIILGYGHVRKPPIYVMGHSDILSSEIIIFH